MDKKEAVVVLNNVRDVFRGSYVCDALAMSIKALEDRGTQPTANNSAMDAIAALQSSLHTNYQPVHQFSRDEVLTMLRQLHQ